MRDYDEFLEERKPIYVDIYQKLWNTIGSHETLWFIWFNMVTIVKAVEDTPYQGDILGGQISRYGWSERTPFWCWDLLYLNDDEHFEDIKSMLQYRKLVEDLKEAGTYSSAGIIWQQIIDRNDID